MNIKVKNTEAGGRNISFAINKSTSVLDLKKLVKKDFGVSEECQRLYFRGKLMENPIKVYDYGVSMNKTIQLVVRNEGASPVRDKKSPKKSLTKGENKMPPDVSEEEKTPTPARKKEPAKNSRKSVKANNISKYFRVGDWVDFKDLTSEDTAYQGWFEGRIIDIIEYPSNDNPNSLEILYEVQHRRSATEAPIFVTLNELRPISRVNVKPADLNLGDMVLANYNSSEPSKRGYWFDFIPTKMNRTSARPIIHGTIIAGPLVLEDCIMMYPNELMKIEPVKLIADRNKHERKVMQTEPATKRYCAAACSCCMDIPGRKCRQCGCAVCFSKKDPEKQLICDECQNYFHAYCLKEPLTELPEGDWFCDGCQKPSKRTPLKSKKEASPKKTASKKVPSPTKTEEKELEEDKKKEEEYEEQDKSNSPVDESWNDPLKFMKTFGCSPEKISFGPINGVEVGTTWRFKGQVLHAGFHRAPLAYIHSRMLQGVYSVLLDKDAGRVKDKGDDLILSFPDVPRLRSVRAFASNCPAPFNPDKKVEPANWKDGKPIRIIRGHQFATKFCPKLGYRYDGLYKVVKYHTTVKCVGAEKKKRSWQFHLRRDDDAPAPWTEKGKKRMSELGIDRVIYPARQSSTSEGSGASKEGTDLDKTTVDLIERDTDNSLTWQRLKKCLPAGKELFIKNVTEEFTCKGCQKLVHIPITSPCGHNSCLGCFQKMFMSKNFVCPACKHDLGSKYLLLRNHRLRDILLNFFPGYDTDR